MAFKSALPYIDKSPNSQSRWASPRVGFEKIVLNNLSLTSWLLIGGLLQSIILLLTPSSFAFVPILTTLLILLARLGQNLLITYNYLPNPYLQDAILYKVSAQIPNTEGEFSSDSAAEGVICMHLGAKFNHPLGIFAPNAKQLGDHLNNMIIELDKDKSVSGYLGGTNNTSFDERGALETNHISYWRSIEAVHEFAYGPAHRKAWEWWNKLTPEGSQHLGIHHEIFAAAPGQWESVYLNFQPTLLGATTFLRKGDKLIGGTVDDKWISPLMDASKGKLKGSAGRLGWQPESLYKKFEHVPVEYAETARE